MMDRKWKLPQEKSKEKVKDAKKGDAEVLKSRKGKRERERWEVEMVVERKVCFSHHMPQSQREITDNGKW